MKVFSLYKKLIRSYAIVVIMYVSIFAVLAIILSFSSGQTSSQFIETRVTVVLDNYDEGSTLTEGLKEYLSKYVNYTEVKEDKRKDALFFRRIYSIITIPEDFESDYLAGKDVSITQERIDENATSVAVDRAINKYLNYTRVYLNQTDKSLDEIIVLVNDVLQNEAEAITLIEESDQLTSSGSYYRTLSYILMSVILTVVGLITISFRKFDVRRRLIVSPYPMKNSNLEMIFGNSFFTTALVILLCGISLLLYPGAMFSKSGILLIVNTFIFSFTALSMSYCMSLLIRKVEVLSGVNNVFSLGSAFLTGAFVPQFLLSKGILTFAHILPNYYYVYNVDLITSANNLNSDNINKIILYMLVQMLFAALFIMLSIVLSKKQAKSED